MPEEDSVREPVIKVIDLIVDQTKTFDQLVIDGGSGHVNLNVIGQNFPLGLIAEGKELVRVRFYRDLTEAQVLAEFVRLHLELTTSAAYIASVGAMPGDEHKVPVLDLAQVWTSSRNLRFCLSLRRYNDELFTLRRLNNEIEGYYWFLALRSEVSPVPM